MVNQERSSGLVAVTCACGRGLRAKAEQVGSEIRCWDCHRMVLVPVPRQGQQVARELSDVALVVIQGPGMNSVLAAAAIVTVILAIPRCGAWCSIIALAMGASAYGEIIRRVSRRKADDPQPGWRETFLPRSFAKGVLCLLMAAGTAVSLWISNSSPHRSPHWNWLGLSIAAASWTILPLLMMAVYGERQDGESLGLGRSLRLLARHPLAILFALAVIPITLAMFEVIVASIFYLQGDMPFFAIDFMPMPTTFERPIISIDFLPLSSTPEPPKIAHGIAFFHGIDFRNFPPSMFVAGYLDGLRHGYSFVGAIPASLSRAPDDALDPVTIGLDPILYALIRGFITLVVLSGLIAAFAVQAQWLGSISSLERKRSAP